MHVASVNHLLAFATQRILTLFSFIPSFVFVPLLELEDDDPYMQQLDADNSDDSDSEDDEDYEAGGSSRYVVLSSVFVVLFVFVVVFVFVVLLLLTATVTTTRITRLAEAAGASCIGVVVAFSCSSCCYY
jgi:hypothetical protein